VGKLLQREGYEVIAVDRAAASVASGHLSSECELVVDITDTQKLRAVFQGRAIYGIVHLAAILPTAAQRDPALATRVNVQGSLNLFETAREFGVRRFVFGSSLSVYGTCRTGRVVTELDGAAPEDVYGAAKLYVERVGEVYRELYGIEFVSLRIGRVVGPGARSATSAWRSEIFELLQANGPAEIVLPYVASETVLLVHVDDVARMLVSLLQVQHPAHGVYNACCEAVRVGELKERIERLNANVHIRLGGAEVGGNPRGVDSSRFAGEFGFTTAPIFELMAGMAGGDAR
jgi:nucleoside-diphosphate-sugar epimerase